MNKSSSLPVCYQISVKSILPIGTIDVSVPTLSLSNFTSVFAPKITATFGSPLPFTAKYQKIAPNSPGILLLILQDSQSKFIRPDNPSHRIR